MRILLTNDDGIHAPGLFALYEAFSQDYEVSVVAPETEMSAVGHAITLSQPLRVRSVTKGGRFYGYAVSGTPADCVKIAVKELLDHPPDMVLSGINLGRNVGMDILYSGTVSAATEAAFLGFKAAAISLDTRKTEDFTLAAQFSRAVVRFVMENGLRDGTALNVNIPALPPEQIQGVCFARQGLSRFEERFERRNDPRGNVYYWLMGETTIENGTPDTDFVALKSGMITITPIHYDLTCREELERIQKLRPPAIEV
ncbi:MAG: 5'/3'-nucleotidase SurE [Deltaproteobacteria bacterium]|nr:5'/3'-nucleotidase SurE [Deltaproteobacteria bacterium]MBW1927586.1 5'/3'-nucleotidase SurE [Deltaproteobacteria bacterium]MBW2024625.1 5'/3'-nucleotidase SurE [Deltaproteobacteria bacterium]MBW2125676.1 5'/3'-nucleotidase SurE [Deltaproteobacteria bacterium]RLB24600.1 MAG: 5'/3'-nucleotidase SurE [Deltaproteobacteria bacterium]